MAQKTGIEWTDSTWSPIRARVKTDAGTIAREKGYGSLVAIADKMAGRVGQHCEHVSPGCLHCYAETNNHRCLPSNGTGLPYDRRSRDLVEPFIDMRALQMPFKWLSVKALEEQMVGPPGWRTKVPVQFNFKTRSRRIFVENQSDLFGDWVTDEMLDTVFGVMALTPQHIYQVLTKRPARMFDYFCSLQAKMMREAAIGFQALRLQQQRGDGPVLEWSGLPMPNVWLGVSPVNQETADEYIPTLLEVPAAVRFLSYEPALGSIDLNLARKCGRLCSKTWDRRACALGSGLNITVCQCDCHRDVDWVIAGGESGPGSRRMQLEWVQSIRDQCQAAGVPFFFKQWGDWHKQNYRLNPRLHPGGWNPNQPKGGAMLDGREWKEFPKGRV